MLAPMTLRALFLRHPASVGETYAEHLQAASGFGVRMILGGIACLIHGVLPFLFLSTGSNAIRRLHQEMVVARHARAGGADDAQERLPGLRSPSSANSMMAPSTAGSPNLPTLQ